MKTKKMLSDGLLKVVAVNSVKFISTGWFCQYTQNTMTHCKKNKMQRNDHLRI